MNKTAFEHWRQYDISNNLRSNCSILQKDLDGKIRVTIGEQDHFLADRYREWESRSKKGF